MIYLLKASYFAQTAKEERPTSRDWPERGHHGPARGPKRLNTKGLTGLLLLQLHHGAREE